MEAVFFRPYLRHMTEPRLRAEHAGVANRASPHSPADDSDVLSSTAAVSGSCAGDVAKHTERRRSTIPMVPGLAEP